MNLNKNNSRNKETYHIISILFVLNVFHLNSPYSTVSSIMHFKRSYTNRISQQNVYHDSLQCKLYYIINKRNAHNYRTYCQIPTGTPLALTIHLEPKPVHHKSSYQSETHTTHVSMHELFSLSPIHSRDRV